MNSAKIAYICRKFQSLAYLFLYSKTYLHRGEGSLKQKENNEYYKIFLMREYSG